MILASGRLTMRVTSTCTDSDLLTRVACYRGIVRKRTVYTTTDLTAQQAQIAYLAGNGLN